MKRFRTHFNIFGPLAVLVAMFALDPDNGMGIKVFAPGTTVLMLKYLSGLLLVSGAFWIVKVLLDYPEADTRRLFFDARRGSTGAGLALIARTILFCAVVYALGSSAHAADSGPTTVPNQINGLASKSAVLVPPKIQTFIPAQAYTYAPMLKAEQARFWQDHPAPQLLAGLVEQESCLSLTHSKCWNPASRLKTSREEGAGFGQITRAYRSDGSERFDALAEMRSAHRELAGLTWANVYQSPGLQLRAIVLKVQDDFKALAVVGNPITRLDFADAAYNAGRGSVRDRRTACGLKAGCDPQVWFGNVELVCLTGAKALYGTRSACDITREHVQMVSRVRSAKYRRIMT